MSPARTTSAPRGALSRSPARTRPATWAFAAPSSASMAVSVMPTALPFSGTRASVR